MPKDTKEISTFCFITFSILGDITVNARLVVNNDTKLYLDSFHLNHNTQHWTYRANKHTLNRQGLDSKTKAEKLSVNNLI